MSTLKNFTLPQQVEPIIQMLLKHHLTVVLVGGAVRDFLIAGRLGLDLDFEVQCPSSEKKWPEVLGELKTELERQYQVEFVDKFYVLKVQVGEVCIELVPARLESYPDTKTFHHRDIEVEFVRQLSFDQSFKRRDFTCNAIGIVIEHVDGSFQFTLQDPFQGQQHIESKTLVPCHQGDFVKDPVRFVRALRFSLSLHFKISQELESCLSHMDLSYLSTYYFLYEAFKGRFFIFCAQFFSYIEKYDLPVNDKILDLKFLAHYEHCDLSMEKALEVVEYLARAGEDHDNILALGAVTQTKKSLIKKVLQSI